LVTSSGSSGAANGLAGEEYQVRARYQVRANALLQVDSGEDYESGNDDAAALLAGAEAAEADGAESDDGFAVALWRRLAARHARQRRSELRYRKELAACPQLFEGFRSEWIVPKVR